MRVAIFGSRTYPRLEEIPLLIYRLPPSFQVVTGGAWGTDLVAETAAYVHCFDRPKVFLPDVSRTDNRRYAERNQRIIDYAEHDPGSEALWIAFRNPRDCRGTDITISMARRVRLPGVVIEPDRIEKTPPSWSRNYEQNGTHWLNQIEWIIQNQRSA